jgi:hypothetical protein
MSMVQSQVLRQTQRMSAEQRLEAVLHQRQELVAAVWGDEYGDHFKVDEQCTVCERKLTLIEILKGFSAEPTDTMSRCPKCGIRYQPRLVGMKSISSHVEVAFLCPGQTLHALKGREQEPFHALIMTSHGRSALIHFGSLKAAFAKLEVKYTFDPRKGWQDRVRPFFGKVPDAMIAKVVGASASTVGRMRREMKIMAFRGYVVDAE